MSTRWAGCCIVALVACGAAIAATDDYRVDPVGAEHASRGVAIVQLVEDRFLGAPDGPQVPAIATANVALPDPAVAGGIYTSPYHHFRLRIPRVAGQDRVIVRQSRVSARPDGTVITAHVVFEPASGYGVAALVVTRIRDDGPKDADAVLRQFEPSQPAEYPLYAQQGVTFRRRQGPLGLVLERTIRNRAPTPFFPYRTGIDGSRPRGSLGFTRLLVLDGFLCEFSLIVDGARAPDAAALAALAEAEMDAFMGGLLTPPQR